MEIKFNFDFRRHFGRTTVSLGDHNVKVYNDANSVFRKIRRIIRFPTYDNNLIDGDLALLHLTDPVELSGVLILEHHVSCITFSSNSLFYRKHQHRLSPALGRGDIRLC